MPYKNKERLEELRHPDVVNGSHHHYPEDMRRFLMKYPSWNARFDASEPVYAIPLPACIERYLKIFFPDEEQRAAEIEYAQICWTHRCIGIWEKNQIRFPPLRQTRVAISSVPQDFLAKVFPDGLPDDSSIQTKREELDSTNERLLGIVGWCNTDPGFCKDRNDLRTSHESLPIEFRIRIGELHRASHSGSVVLDNGSVCEVSEVAALASFLELLVRFLDKWSIAQIVTWDWMLPQGPIAPDFLPDGHVSKPKHGVSVWIPTNYPLLDDDAFQKKIHDLQVIAANIQGMPTELVALAHHKSFAQMARVLHLEETLRSRFPEDLPRGGVEQLILMIVKYLDVKDDHARRLRHWISKCRNGNRDTIKDLA